MNDIASGEALTLALIVAVNLGVFVSIVLVIMMQPGFMLLEAGSISRHNAVNDIYKNALDLCVGGLAFWLVGYDVLTGESALWSVIGDVGLIQTPPPAAPSVEPAAPLAFLFQLAFASTAATICSGAVTARISPHTYLIFTALFSGLLYPILAFLVWSPQSVLYGEFRDFAGAVVVHAAGAAAGLAGALLLGPRLGFNGYDPVGLGPERIFRLAKRHAPHNLPMAALGVFLLWLGWFGFNCGTYFAGGVPEALPGVDPQAHLEQAMASVGAILAATVLGPAACALTTALLHVVLDEDLDLLDTLNGVIAGAVAVTGAANLLSPGEAILVGVVAAVVFRATRLAFLRITVDDPVSAIAAHGLTGVLGVAVVGLVAPDASLVMMLKQLLIGLGLFSGMLLASLAAFKLAEGISRILFLTAGRRAMAKASKIGFLRIDHRAEIQGIDAELHGQDAYGGEWGDAPR